ncbi:MAG: hypothetical protein LKCHEGNO_02520 [Burkholderiaceae bacterium]|nr:hypothetical protein [Burkholderiaceae bacterium]
MPSELPAAVHATRTPRESPRERPRAAWLRAAARVRSRFWLKAVGIAAFMALFFVGYFHLLRHPLQPPLQMPLSAIDTWIGFRAWALWPYLSLWVYVAWPPVLMPDVRALLRYGAWVGALCVAGLASFYWWPTAVPPTSLPADLAGFDLLRGVDAAGNACPSMHVAAATFSALWLHRLLRELELPGWLRWVNLGWFALIVWSTLAVKQHVWWDAVAGALLALAVGLPSLRLVDTKTGSASIAGGCRSRAAHGAPGPEGTARVGPQ